MPTPDVVKVSGSDSPTAVAADIAEHLRASAMVHVEALGPQAVDRAIRAVVICRSYGDCPGFDLYVAPSFVTWSVLDDSRTAVRLTVYLYQSVASTGEAGTPEDLSESRPSTHEPSDGSVWQAPMRPKYRRRRTMILIVLGLIGLAIITSPLWLFVPL